MTFRQVLILMMVVSWDSLAGNALQLPPFYAESMVRIDRHADLRTETLETYLKKPLLVSVFAPNCFWCSKQFDTLQKWRLDCPENQLIMIGVRGNKHELRRELKRKKNQYPAYLASKNINYAIGEKKPVPQLLLFDSSGELVVNVTGYISTEQLKRMTEQHNLSLCHG